MTITANKIYLAPMEGVIDASLRDLLTKINHYDLCITEFVRVVDRKVPIHTFTQLAPELRNNGFTENGTPIRVQLLGQDPNWMAENARIVTSLGSNGVDINFGCPAPTVNKSKGGAALLKSPETIYHIISAVKHAVADGNHEVSVKIRLGFDDTHLFKEILSAIEAASPNQLTIHARTKKQGYKPPAYWHLIEEANNLTAIEVIANGEIWSLEDAQSCIVQAKTTNLMLGRGALATPNLANVIRQQEQPCTWTTICSLLLKYADLQPSKEHQYYYPSRIKQWLKYLKMEYVQAYELFDVIKKETDKTKVMKIIEQQLKR